MEKNRTETNGGGRGFALFISALLLCAIAWCCWMIWTASREADAEGAEITREVNRLREERDALKKIIDLPPCEIAPALAKAGLAPMSEPSPASTPKPASPVATRPGASADPLPDAQAVATPEDIESGCVFIVSANGAGQLSTGSGFFVAPEYVATNRHVVQNSLGKILVTSKALGKPALGSVVAVGKGPNDDYAILRVPAADLSRVKIMNFAKSAKKTEKVGAWGYPDLVGKNDPEYLALLKKGDIKSAPELSYSEGVISAVLRRDPETLVHTAPISPGNSGGPLVNADGQIVGINTMITLDEDSYRQASIALSSGELKKFLSDNGIKVKD